MSQEKRGSSSANSEGSSENKYQNGYGYHYKPRENGKPRKNKVEALKEELGIYISRCEELRKKSSTKSSYFNYSNNCTAIAIIMTSLLVTSISYSGRSDIVTWLGLSTACMEAFRRVFSFQFRAYELKSVSLEARRLSNIATEVLIRVEDYEELKSFLSDMCEKLDSLELKEFGEIGPGKR